MKLTVRRDVTLEFGFQNRGALFSSHAMSDGVFDFDLVQHGAVIQSDGQGIADGSGRGLVVVRAEMLVLDTLHLGAESIYTGIGSNGIRVIFRRQPAENKRDCDHVLDCVIAIGEIGERALLVDNADLHGGKASEVSKFFPYKKGR